MTSLQTVVSASAPNFGMGDTHSWVRVDGANRPLFARAMYMTNASDMSVSLSANNLNMNIEDAENLLRSQLAQSGFVFLTGGATAINGNFSTVQVVSACKIASIAATNSTTNGLTQYELPVNFSFNGPITSISLTYGAAIVYKL